LFSIRKWLRENKGKEFSDNYWKKSFRRFIGLTIILMVITSSFSFSANISLGAGIFLPFQDNQISVQERVHNEIFLEKNQDTCWTQTLNSGGIIMINITVLENSFSNVSFVSDLENVTSYVAWLPNPINFILTPGESYQETFTLQAGISEQDRAIGYYASCVNSEANATVHWWYEILNSGTAEVIGIEYLGGLFLIAFVVLYYSRKKRKLE